LALPERESPRSSAWIKGSGDGGDGSKLKCIAQMSLHTT
jgi:hypothetical protein